MSMSQDAYAAALTSEQARRRADNARYRKRANAAAQATEARLEQLAAALGAARQERAALAALHGSLAAADRHQGEMLQAAQVAALALAAADAGGGEAARRLAHSQIAEGASDRAGFLAAIGGWTSRTAACVRSLVQKGCFDALVWGGYVPSDADMRDYLQVCSGAEIVARLARTQGVCADLLAQWESSAVEEVDMIEAGVRHMCSIRSRFLQALARHRPEIVVTTLTGGKLTPAPAGRCRLHPSLRFVADLDWSSAQRAALRPRWAEYRERIESCRALAHFHLRGLQSDTAAAVATWAAAESLPALTASYAGVFDNAAGLDAWLRLEATAWADLAACCYELVTPYQALCIAAKSQPYFADYAQIVGWVVEGGGVTDGAEGGESEGGEGSAAAAMVCS